MMFIIEAQVQQSGTGVTIAAQSDCKRFITSPDDIISVMIKRRAAGKHRPLKWVN